MLIFKHLPGAAYDALVDTIVTHDGVEHAGYLAFLALLSLFPFLVFFFSIAGALGQTDVGTTFIEGIVHNQLLPQNVINALVPRIEEIISGPPQGLLTFAIIGAIWTASSTVEGLRTILNRAYRIHTPPAYILRRLLSIAQFLILTAILIVVTLLFLVAPVLWQTFVELASLEAMPAYAQLVSFSDSSFWTYIRYGLTGFVVFVIISASYIIIPNIKQGFKKVAIGAFAVLLLWFAAGGLLALYVSHFEQVHIIYGSLGGLIAAMLFFYITAMIFIFGAELNYHMESRLHHRIELKDGDSDFSV